LENVVVGRCRPASYTIYRRSVERIVKHIGQIQLTKLTAQQVQTLLGQLREDGYAPATIHSTRGTLINALHRATDWQLIPRNVARSSVPPKGEDYEPRILSLDEAHRLLDAAKGSRLEALWKLALSFGLRRGEVLGLRWRDVDFEHGILKISVSLQLIAGKRVLVKPKTKTSVRTLPLPPSLIAALHQHKAQQSQERLFCGRSWHDHGLVFCSRIGTPIWPRNLHRDLRQLLAQAGIPRIRVHDLRHSCASFLAAQNVPPKVAQEILGHSDVRTTLKIYTHTTDAQKREAAEQMEQCLEGGAGCLSTAERTESARSLQ
jgi:integrase